MDSGQELRLTARRKADLASLQARREAIIASISEVEETKRNVLWTLNNKWLGMKDTLRRFDKSIEELEELLSDAGIEVKAVSQSTSMSRAMPVLKGELVYCLKCSKVILAGRKYFEDGYCYRCERNRVLRLWHLAEARSAKLDREFEATVK